MKTDRIIMVLLAVLLESCAAPPYLPSSDKIDINPYGSYISIARYTKPIIEGELIAIDTGRIILLTETTGKCITISVRDVKRFTLRYAQPRHYGWSIPVAAVATVMHGWMGVLTGPVNLIVAICVTASGENAFKFKSKNMTYDRLRMFARFPQGIPPDIDTTSIK